MAATHPAMQVLSASTPAAELSPQLAADLGVLDNIGSTTSVVARMPGSVTASHGRR
jgi:hypothetical protein